VIPLQVSGVIDTDMSKLTASELMMWGLSNLWKEGKEGGYVIRHAPRPVNDFQPDPIQSNGDGANLEHNFFEKAFPCLFPYGEGGIEATRVVKV
jgi:hypothetical protein